MSWTVASVMTHEVVAVRPQATYRHVAELMAEHAVSALPVVDVTDSDGRLVGIVSEADLMVKEERRGEPRRRWPPPRPDERSEARTAGDLMTTPVVTVRPEATLAEAARLMHAKGVKRLPVVDARGRLVGMVSRADLIKPYLRSEESIQAEIAEHVLRHTLAIDPQTVKVTVRAGVVTLEGQLETRSLCRIAARLAAAVEGVVGVDDLLTWALDDGGPRPEAPERAAHLTPQVRAR